MLQNPVVIFVVGIDVFKVIRLIFMMVDSLDSAKRELKFVFLKKDGLPRYPWVGTVAVDSRVQS